MEKISIFNLLLLFVFSVESESLLVHDGWTGVIKSSGQEFPATVPGGIYTDLENAQLIPKTLNGYKDVKNRWIANETLIYVTHFKVTATFLKAHKVALVFHGLDTFAKIFVNENLVGMSDNMFVKYAFDVKEYLKEGSNKLEVLFASPLKVSNYLYTRQKKDYEVVPTCVPAEYNGECHVNHIRKMQCSYGWDWGVALPSTGIWKNIEIMPVTEAYVTEITADVIKKKSTWKIIVAIFFDTLSYEKNISLVVDVQVVLEVENGKTVMKSANNILIEKKQKYGDTSVALEVPQEVYCCVPDRGHRNPYGKLYHKFKNVKYSLQKKDGQLKLSNSLNYGHSKYTVPDQIEDKRDPIILDLLPHLLVRRVRGKKSTDVINVAEARKAFILHVTESVELWWPNGYGDQKLYKLSTKVKILNYETQNEKLIGFRTVELVQEPVGEGLSFYFRVNGLAIFAKGSNYIPGSIYPELGTKLETILPLLTSAKEANMNMLRVWGGGTYETDLFYELADKLGILIWQDFMFACSMYPSAEWFLKTVKDEVVQSVRRLKSHPSIALWAGSNENQLALYGNWYGTNDKQVYRDDFTKLYVDLIKTEVEKLDSTRDFIVSSPGNGLYDDKNGYFGPTNPQSNLYGDVHYYRYDGRSWDINQYPRVRFSSEYGFQSWPSIQTLIKAAELKEDLKIGSEFLKHRQHLPGGDAYMENLIEENFIIPKSNDARRDLEDFIYLSQINQAVSIKIETESYRQGKSSLNSRGEGYTRGALYWQLNDVWAAPSWSSIEFGGLWKMLHYFAKDFFAPVIVTPRLSEDHQLTIYVISDLHRTLDNLSVILYIYKWGSKVPLFVQTFGNITVKADEAKAVKTFKLDDLLRSAGCGSLALAKKNCLVEVMLRNDATSYVIGANYVYPTSLKYVSLPAAKITMNVNPKPLPGKISNYFDYEIEFESDKIALFVWLDAGLINGRFSQNGFHILKGKIVIVLHTMEATTPEEITKNVQFKSLSDLYNI